jgi:hypothetical protein
MYTIESKGSLGEDQECLCTDGTAFVSLGGPSIKKRSDVLKSGKDADDTDAYHW